MEDKSWILNHPLEHGHIRLQAPVTSWLRRLYSCREGKGQMTPLLD